MLLSGRRRLRLSVKNVEQSDGKAQQVTETVEAEVDEMSSQLHHLQQNITTFSGMLA